MSKIVENFLKGSRTVDQLQKDLKQVMGIFTSQICGKREWQEGVDGDTTEFPCKHGTWKLKMDTSYAICVEFVVPKASDDYPVVYRYYHHEWRGKQVNDGLLHMDYLKTVHMSLGEFIVQARKTFPDFDSWAGYLEDMAKYAA